MCAECWSIAVGLLSTVQCSKKSNAQRHLVLFLSDIFYSNNREISAHFFRVGGDYFRVLLEVTDGVC